ncbi:HesA/MoeB/ThiF family protein [Olleya sp. HaHaR_3_96]|uniref:HesA/MoeB/ThiF family protein n=1 Tax=Olleya sp. HaHaR_3_96 TaxID=2745560 RepID=UPI001C4E9129|nr:HesA/MoeB/ThiF family protein [Olleya sp. HaHaR_3_96]QXP59366.1 molybdopterin-synthase adenylyltransferase MoeB [Olleya sp. HaHaR_3_96]
MNRYSRHIVLSEIGQTGQDKLLNAKVLVIGAGGLGCPILQYLTAAGVGQIGIVDFDTVALSNLQRQVLFGTSSLGLNKAEAAKARLTDLNNSIVITAYPILLTYQNALSLFKQYDIIVDGTDNFETRYLINDAAIISNKPVVFGAIYKFEGQVSVFNYNNGPSYRCLFSNQQEHTQSGNCEDVGVLGILPGIIGCMQANEVLKIILEIGHILSGKLLIYNALQFKSSILKINKREEEINKVLEEQQDFESKKRSFACDTHANQISIIEALTKANIQFIDVRELNELPKIEGLSITSIPLSDLENNLNKIDLKKESLLFCQSGKRSKQAVIKLKALKIEQCYFIKEGISEIKIHLEKHLNHDR